MICKKHNILRIEESDNIITIVSTGSVHWAVREFLYDILFSMRASYLSPKLEIDENRVTMRAPEGLSSDAESLLKDSLILAYVLSSINARKSIYIPSYKALVFGLVTGLIPDVSPINENLLDHLDKISLNLQGASRRTGRLCRALRGTIYDPETTDFSRYVKIVSSIRGDTSEVISALGFMSEIFTGREIEFSQVLKGAEFHTILGTFLEIFKDLLAGEEK